jgi:hypothetical protein
LTPEQAVLLLKGTAVGSFLLRSPTRYEEQVRLRGFRAVVTSSASGTLPLPSSPRLNSTAEAEAEANVPATEYRYKAKAKAPQHALVASVVTEAGVLHLPLPFEEEEEPSHEAYGGRGRFAVSPHIYGSLSTVLRSLSHVLWNGLRYYTKHQGPYPLTPVALSILPSPLTLNPSF